MTKDYSARKYRIVSQDWELFQTQYRDMKRIIREILGDQIQSIEHVGSTSIPGLAGKPNLDVLVIVKDITSIGSFRSRIAEKKLELAKDYIGAPSWLLFRMENGEKIINVHVLEHNHPKARQMIIMRDYLRAHENDRNAYAVLKQTLAGKYPDNYVAYREGKKDFLENIESKAEEWQMGKDSA